MATVNINVWKCSNVFITYFLLACSRHVQIAKAVVANPIAFTETQPDGSPINLYVRGDEHYSWLEDPLGYTVIRVEDTAASQANDGPVLASGNIGNMQPQQPQFVYANLDSQGNLQPTSYQVGKVDPSTIDIPVNAAALATASADQPESPQSASHMYNRRRRYSDRHIPPHPASARRKETGRHSRRRHVQRRSGQVTNLVVMVRWADCQYNATNGLPNVADLNDLFNGAENSVKSVYLQNSYGALTINSIFSGWITVNTTEKEAAQGDCYGCVLHQALQQALAMVDNLVDFRSLDGNNDHHIDAIAFLHSGYGAEFTGDRTNRVWSHKWVMPIWTSKTGVDVANYHISPAMWGSSGTERARVGTVAHETGHFLGLPDLYDTDGDGRGLGKYSLMGNSWGFDSTQRYPGLMDAWSRIKLGWANVTEIIRPGNFSIAYAGKQSVIYKISTGFPAGEYLLIENRLPMGYDKTLPQGGLAIYHIDEAKVYSTVQGYPGQADWPQNGNHYGVALLQADGLYELEKNVNSGKAGDLYANNAVLGPKTVPSTDAYQNGHLKATGVEIVVNSAPAQVMTFTVNMPQCSDGIQNGDEIQTDCGGLYCAPCFTTTITATSTQTVIVPGPTVTFSAPIPSPVTITMNAVPVTVAVPTTVVQWVTVTSTPPAGITNSVQQTLSVSQISVSQPKSASTFTVTALVTVVDGNQNIVGSVVVIGKFTRGGSTTIAKSKTSVTGSAVLKTKSTGITSSTLTFCVTGLVKAGYVYTSNTNQITCVTVSR